MGGRGSIGYMSKRFLSHAVVYGLYLLVAVVITYPLITTLDSRVIGHPFGDSTEYLRHIWSFRHALQTGHAPFAYPLLLYPDGLSGALLWSIPLQSFPAWLLAFALPLPAAFNIAALLRLALNGWAMYQLVHSLQFTVHSQEQKTVNCRLMTVNCLPAFLAGLVFMAYPAFQGQLAVGHTGLLALWPTPLLMLALLRLREDTPRRWIAFAAALVVISSWGGLVLLIYLVAPVVALALWLARRDRRALRRMLTALALGGLVSALIILPTLGDTAPNAGAVTFSAPLLGIVSPSFNHPLYAGLDYPRRAIGVDPFESASYIGLIGGGLALIGALRRRAARPWLALAAVAWVFSLGPLLKVYDAPVTVSVGGYTTPIPLPWALFQALPGLDIARTPARFNFAVGLAVAVLAGYGAQILFSPQRTPRSQRFYRLSLRFSASSAVRSLFFLFFALLIIFDYQFFWPMPTIPAVIPDAVAELGEGGDIRAVFDIPWAHPLVDKEGLYLQTAHGLPMIGGHIARETPLNPAKGWLLQTTLDPALLDAAGADIIILHREWDEPELEAFARERLGAPFYEDERLALFDAPPYTGEPPGFTAAAPRVAADRADLHFYTPTPGEVTLTGLIAGDDGRIVSIRLGDERIDLTLHGEIALRLPLRIEQAGYHTVSIAADPACPRILDAALRCRGLRFEGLAIEG